MTIDKFRGDYFFLSNFYPCTIIFGGRYYNSVEHAFQAAKTLKEDEREKISYMKTAAEAKRFGRVLTLRPQWNNYRKYFMRYLLQQKFNKEYNPDLYRLLKNTGDATLIEGNNWNDTYWGVCKGEGENVLGKILMEIRDDQS